MHSKHFHSFLEAPAPEAMTHLIEKDKGMTIIEVMIASVVMAMVLISTFSATTQAMLMSECSRDTSRAVDWIQAEAEYLRSLSWTEIQSVSSSGNFAQPSPNDRFLSSRLVSDRRSGQKIIRLMVMWNDSRGKFHSQSSITFINEHGI